MAKKLIAIVLLVMWIDFLIFTSVHSELKIICPLVWKSSVKGEPLPEDAVWTSKDQHYIAVARYLFFSALGRMDFSTGLAYAAVQDSEDDETANFIRSTSYSVLTNPNDCALSWFRTEEGGTIPEDERPFAMWSHGGYISRVRIGNLELGALLSLDFAYVADDRWAYKKPAGAAKVLKSTVNLRCELYEFDFHGNKVEEGDPDFLGIDKIINDADSVVSQTVEHRKTYIERYTISEATSFEKVTAWEVKGSIPLPVKNVNLDFEVRWGNYEGESDDQTIRHEKEEEVVSLRTVVVPPFTTVDICSIVYIPNDYQMEYTAEARYSIKGYSAAKVREILEKENIEGLVITGSDGNSVVATVTGKLAVTVPTTTKFIISEQDDERGCRNIFAKIQQLKNARNDGITSKIGINNIKQEIHNMINRVK